MYPRKLHDHFSFDPRLEQYVYAEIFPLCDDFYFYGTDQLVTPFPFIIEHPFIKPPMPKWHEELRQTDAGPSKKEESDYRSYAYIDRIIRPGYDLKRSEQQDLQRLHQLQHWLRGIFAPRLSYKYRVERLSDDNE
ncbi:unnamed protein product [Acanthocheilonema viteae]|uniref:Uncharacterized protein n=1 Tax=Acanthocheilonema viteae TaxID=6277 RepID=A0A498SSI0_ACAVI|nr:unnamed protein product [Acanthocheilonema viteae]